MISGPDGGSFCSDPRAWTWHTRAPPHRVYGLLAAGHHVRVPVDLSTGRADRLDPRADLRVGDVADRGTAAACVGGMAGVFHLAAASSVARANEDWPGTHRVNRSDTVAILDAARAAGGVGAPDRAAAVPGRRTAIALADGLASLDPCPPAAASAGRAAAAESGGAP